MATFQMRAGVAPTGAASMAASARCGPALPARPAVLGARPVRAAALRRRVVVQRAVVCSADAAAPAPQNAMLKGALAVAGATRAAAGRIGGMLAKINEPLPQEQADALNESIRWNLRSYRRMAFVAPFAAMVVHASGPSALTVITQAVGSFIKLYLLMLFLRVLLTWFPSFDWGRQPWITLRQVTDPYLNLFRGIIPPIMGQIDFTPILGFLILQWLGQVLGEVEDEDPEGGGGLGSDPIEFF